jgi:uncharacterized cupredoxin-like copper-binding protein
VTLTKLRNRLHINECIQSKKSTHMIVTGILAITALAGLTACGGAATADVQPTATTAITQVTPTTVPIEATATTAVLQPEPAATETMAMSESEMSTELTPTTADVVPTATQASAAQDAASVTEVQATLIEWSIQLSQSEVPAGKVRFTVTNQGQMMHNLTILDSTGVLAQTPTFSSSQGAQTLEVDLAPGTYTLICSLPGHAARGQQTTLIVK